MLLNRYIKNHLRCLRLFDIELITQLIIFFLECCGIFLKLYIWPQLFLVITNIVFTFFKCCKSHIKLLVLFLDFLTDHWLKFLIEL